MNMISVKSEILGLLESNDNTDEEIELLTTINDSLLDNTDNDYISMDSSKYDKTIKKDEFIDIMNLKNLNILEKLTNDMEKIMQPIEDVTNDDDDDDSSDDKVSLIEDV